jgi:TRAP-type C4-dicarboxylate transport system permease small subunit
MIPSAGLPNVLAATLPENSHSGYVAAAYIVFFVLVLVYVAIMAYRLTRVERSVRELSAERREERSDDAARERETA